MSLLSFLCFYVQIMFMFAAEGVESYDFNTNRWKHEDIQQKNKVCGKTKLISSI